MTDNIFNFRQVPSITVTDKIYENGTWKFAIPAITAGTGSTPSWIDVVLSGTMSLTLVNAKEDGLYYLKLFGGTEQRNLPVGYTEYDGLIESNGLAYIDLNCTLTQDDEIELEFTKTNNVGSRDIFGSRDSASSNNISVILASSGNVVEDFNNSDYTDYRLNTSVSLNTRYKVVMNKTGRYLYQGDTLVASNTTACPDTITTVGCYLFSLAGTGLGSKFIGIIHRCLIKGKRDLVPCGNGTTYGMYDKLNGVFYPNANTQGSFTVGNATVPTPTTPVDIVSNNGVVKYGALGKNLFNPTKVLFGYYRERDTGNKLQNSSNFMSSDDGYISCLPNTTYTFVGTKKTDGTYSKYNTIYFFDSAKNYLGASPYEVFQPTTGTTPNNCYYLQVRSNPLDNSSTPIQDAFAQFNWQLEQGSTATAYEPYQEGIYTDGTVETVEVTGKNLFDKNQTYINAYVDTGTGKLTQGTTQYSFVIPCKPNTPYTLSGMTANSGWGAFSSNVIGTFSNTYRSGNGTITTGQNDKYLIGMAYATGTQYDYRDTLQVETGSTATDYEPYYNGGSATAEMLLKVGNYQDVQSVLDGSVTRNVGVIVLDGSETIVKNTSTGAPLGYYFSVSNVQWQPHQYASSDITQIIYSSHFLGVSSGVSNLANGTVQMRAGIQYLQNFNFAVSAYTTETELSNYFAQQYNAGTPVIIVYPLATATTETVTAQPLTIQAGTNTVEITQASMDNLELEVSYKAGVAVTITEIENAQLDNSVEVTIQ